MPKPVERTIVAIEINGYASPHRTDTHRVMIREDFYRVVKDSFDNAGIGWSRCRTEDRGDGLLIMAPSDVPKHLFATALPSAIVDFLGVYNAPRAEAARIRLRMAVHSGDVIQDSNGVFGAALATTVRLLDSADLRLALSSSDSVLAVIATSSFVDDANHLPYQRVHVSVKETSIDAWIYVPGVPNRPLQISRGRYCDFFISYVGSGADQVWASWITDLLRDAGYTVAREPLGFGPERNFLGQMTDARARAERIVIVLSPHYVRATRTMPEGSLVTESLGRALIPVRIAPTEPTDFDAISGVDLVAASPVTARRELLAAIERLRHPADTGPSFPGDPATPDLPAAKRPIVLAVHAVADTSVAAEVADSLRVLETEDLLGPIELRAVGYLDEETDAFVDNRAHRADIVLLLVSRDLMATGYGTSNELRLILRRHGEGQASVLPVILRPTSWEKSPFGYLPPLPSDGVPLSQWTSRDEAIKNIVDGVRLAVRDLCGPLAVVAPPADVVPRQVFELGAVFKQTGVPEPTFVAPVDFFKFKMALRQPGLGVILEGPAGSGKTTMLRHAVRHDRDRLGEPELLSARRPADLPKIRGLLNGHTGLVAVDDFQRLPTELQDQLADYLKLLADDDTARSKLVVVGIPGTETSLVSLSPDLATRVQTFRLGRVADELIMQLIEKGEAALNITFDRKAEIVITSTGSLLTAQMLCRSIAEQAGIEKTLDTPTVVRTDLERARAEVAQAVRLKYQRVVDEFVVMDKPDELLCIELLLALAETTDGILRLEPLAAQRPELAGPIRRVFFDSVPMQHDDEISKSLFYDPRGHRLIADDPQFRFYLRQLTRERLLEVAGKRLPVPRDQIFICYSHNEKDARWKERVCVHLRPMERDGALDVWSDSRIAAGDMWRAEIAAALDRARVALLLMSADFFASEFIHYEELPALLAAAETGGCRVIPLLVQPSAFEDRPELARFQSIPSGTTLSEMAPQDAERTLVTLARSIAAG